MPCNKNINELLNIDFSVTSDAPNWSTNASNVVSVSDGKLRLNPDNENTFFDRVLGAIDPNNNRLRIGIDFEVSRPTGSTQTDTEVSFEILKGTEIVGIGTACITEVDISQKAQFHIDRTFKYDDLAGDISIRINVPEGYENYIDLKDIKIEDFNYCDDDVRTYFIFEDFFDEAFTSSSGTIKLSEWKVDGVETLTADFFTDTNSSVIQNLSNWLFADADIDGNNRVSEDVDPKSFNPFAELWRLEFVNPVPFFGGKPTGTQNGKDYGPGILNIGLGKPQILNDALEAKNGAFFIDIDYTKDLRIVMDVVASQTTTNPYTSPSYFRRYFIIWNAEACEGQFYYEDQIGTQQTVDQLFNGFLYGITDQEINIETVGCDETFSPTGNVGNYEYVLDFGTAIGQAGINYNAFSVPDKFTIIWDGQEITSGYVGASSYDQQLINAGVQASEINTGNPSTGSGQLFFNKTTAFPTTAIIRVEAPFSGTGWNVTGICPSQTEETSEVVISRGFCINTVVPSIPSFTAFFDTTDLENYVPANGDIVYADSLKTQVFDGDGYIYSFIFFDGTNYVGDTWSFRINTDGTIEDLIVCNFISLPGVARYTPQDTCVQDFTMVVDIPVATTDNYEIKFRGHFYKDANYSQLQTAISPNIPANVIRNDQDRVLTATTRFQVSVFGGYSGSAIPNPQGDNRLNYVIASLFKNAVLEGEYIVKIYNEGLNCE